MLKELKFSVRTPFTLGLLESVLGALHLLPFDIKCLAKFCLSAGQYLTFYVNFQELAAEQAHQKQVAAHPEIMEDMLLGTGPYSDLNSEFTLPDQAYQQIALVMNKTWIIISEDGVPTQSFIHSHELSPMSFMPSS